MPKNLKTNENYLLMTYQNLKIFINDEKWFLPAYFYCAAAVYNNQKSFKPPHREIIFFEKIFQKILNKLISIHANKREYLNFYDNLKYITKTYRTFSNE